MISRWQMAPIGSVAEVKGGKRLPKGQQLQINDNGSPYIRITDWSDGRIDGDGLLYVPESAQPAIARYRIRSGDVFISIVGTVGLVSEIPDALDGAFLTENAAKICITSADLNSSFLKYVLSSTFGQNAIIEQTVGSTQPKLALHRIKEILVPIPPFGEQQAIAEVLGALDDKIAANTKLAKTATDLVRAEFHRLMKSTDRESTVGDILTLEYGKSLSATKRVPGLVDVFGSGGIVGTHDTALLPGPGVIVGRKGTAGAVHWSSGPYFPIDTTYYVVPRSEDVSQLFAYFLLQSLRLNEMNSDSAVPGLNRNEAHAAKIRMPAAPDLRDFTSRMDPVFDATTQAKIESEKLAATRDALLPQLMSGRLRVKDAEELVSASV